MDNKDINQKWLEDYSEFMSLYRYLLTQSKVIPILSKLTPEEVFNLLYTVQMGCEYRGMQLDQVFDRENL